MAAPHDLDHADDYHCAVGDEWIHPVRGRVEVLRAAQNVLPREELADGGGRYTGIGGAGGDSGGRGGGGGGGGGRGSGGGEGTGGGAGAQDGSFGFLSRVWPGWRRRVAADPNFPFKVLMEETVGLGLAASGMIAARGKEIVNELDFAICDIAVGGTLNFILVYLLSPTAAAVPTAAAAPASALMQAAARLPANVFAPGAFTATQRLTGFLYKGTLFAVCGFAGSVVGTTLSQGLVAARRAMATEEQRATMHTKQLPNVVVNSAAWAGFMFLSSNPRYQAVAGIERFLFAKTPAAFAKLGCGAARTANNVLGGANWVVWAKYLGIQDDKKDD